VNEETDRHHIGSRRLEGRAAILRRISHKDHIMMAWRESTILNEVLANVHGIVDASIKLIFCAEIVNTDQESFSTRHRG